MDVWFAGFACGLAAVFVVGMGLGLVRRRTAPPKPRVSFYPHEQTGVEIRRRLFGD